jgi:hypothetical protein
MSKVKKVLSIPKKVLSGASGLLGFLTPHIPDFPTPEKPPPPAPMADPEDELMRKRRMQAAVRRRQGGLASTILSDNTETLG